MKALPAVIDGITYCSRTEARVAYFLNKIGADPQYEPEGCDIEGECYLPDFFLP